MNEPRHVCLIDASGFIWRAHFGRTKMIGQDGAPVGAVMGFCKMVRDLVARTDADHIAVVFDVSRATFRNRIFADYKANRPPVPDEIASQFKLVREAVDALGLVRVELEDFEADDLIASYAAEGVRLGAAVTVISPDKDLMQLVADSIQIFDPMHDRIVRAAEVKEKFGVEPGRVIDVQALCGDSVDNVPGVPGIGIKTAMKLIAEFGSLENLLECVDQVKPPRHAQALRDNAEIAMISKRLVTLARDVPLPLPLSALTFKEIDLSAFDAFLERLGAVPVEPAAAEVPKPRRVDPMTAALPSFK